MNFNRDKAKDYLRKWQDILRLRDWDIDLLFVEKEWRKTGDIKIDADNKMAMLMLNDYNPKSLNMEEVIVHELIHVKLWGMDQMIESLINKVFGNNEDDPKYEFAMERFFTLLEETTEDLTKGYVALAADDKVLSNGRVMAQVKKEINN